jgi:chromosomal replication initiation ATPase DnaA
MRSEQLLKIAAIFNIKGYSTVSSAIQRVGDLRKKDEKIRKEIDSIIKK